MDKRAAMVAYNLFMERWAVTELLKNERGREETLKALYGIVKELLEAAEAADAPDVALPGSKTIEEIMSFVDKSPVKAP